MNYMTHMQHGRFDYEIKNIVSQLVIVFQKGSIDYVGFVFGFKFAILEAR